jgi:hypothetical protein
MTELEIEEGWPFFEIKFPECQPLICGKNSVCDYIGEQLDYLDDYGTGGTITIRLCALSKDELMALPEHLGC